MLNAGLEMNMKQEGFGRETLSNIVNNLYNVTNMQRTKQAIEAETPSIMIPGLGYPVTREEAVKIATAEPPTRSELDRYLIENPGKTQEEFYEMRTRATDDMRVRWKDDVKAGKTNLSFLEYTRSLKPDIISPEERSRQTAIGKAIAYFRTQEFREDVAEAPVLQEFESTHRGVGRPGDIEYDNAYQEKRLEVIDGMIRVTFPHVRREWDAEGNLVWKDPEEGIVHSIGRK